jgi:1-phosphofructokinase
MPSILDEESGYGTVMADSPDLAIFSPVLVLLIELERDAEDNVEVHLHPGGQGYWVGRMASALGARPVVCAPVGGEAGTVVADLLGRDKVALRSVPMKGDSGTYIHDRRGGERQVILEAHPPALGRHVLDQLFSVTLAAALEAGVCVVAGTQARTLVPPHTYERLVADLVETGVLVVADLAGALLQPALAGRPHILKVSHEELIEDGFARDDSCSELARAIEALQKAGARNVVVSRAAEPALASIEGELVEVVVPQLQVVDHRGAGDSMTAGLALGMIRSLPLRDGLALAAAAGALNVTRHGLATGHAATIAQLAQRVEVRTISDSGR